MREYFSVSTDFSVKMLQVNIYHASWITYRKLLLECGSESQDTFEMHTNILFLSF